MFKPSYPEAVFSYAIKALCDKYNFSQDDLCMCRFSASLKLHGFRKSRDIIHVKRIPVVIDMPFEMLPKKDQGKGKLTVQTQAVLHDASWYDRYDVGLREFIIFNPDQSSLPKRERDSVRFWHWNSEQSDHPLGFSIFVEKQNLFNLRKFAKKIEKHSATILEPPILPRGMLTEIYKNTIGFLVDGKKKKAQYDKYKIPYKRGALLCGSPGAGKTLTCKWLRNLAIEHDIFHRVVTLEEYEEYRRHGSVRQLFSPPHNRAAIVFFDDLDVMVKDRKTGNCEILPFLTNMDGIYPTEGIVFVFTTNEFADLDSAFVRPGRIDLWLPFSNPGNKLRTQFIEERFQDDMLNVLDVSNLVERTDDYTFAEMEEIRKLFAMDFINNKTLSAERTFKLFDRHRDDFQDRVKLGFNKMEDNDEEWEDDDNELWEQLRTTVRNPRNVGIPIVDQPPGTPEEQLV